MKLWIPLLCWSLTACQVGIGSSSASLPTASPSPCAPDCPINDLSARQTVSTAQACAGDRLRIELSHLDQALAAQNVSLLLLYNTNRELNLQPGEKGVPPDFFNPDNLVLATAPITTTGEAVIEVLLQAEYGPDPQGRQLILAPGDSNAVLYLKLGDHHTYHGIPTQLCPTTEV